MNNRWAIAAMALCMCAISALNAFSLQEGMDEVLNTNPIVLERLHNYRATLEDLRTTEAQYLPTLDYSGTIGREKTNSPSTGSKSVSLTSYEHSLQLTQNLFNGFGTTYESDYNKARILAAAYNYVENANDLAFNFTTAYINTLKARDTLIIAESNVNYNNDIKIKVEKLFDAGLTTRSEVEKADTSLSLAQSNFVVAQNNLEDAQFNLERVYGRSVKAEELQGLSFSEKLPASLEELREYSKLHNPSILVNEYNIKAAKAQKNMSYKGYYPTVDLFARQSWANDVGGLTGNDDRFKTGLSVSYNLFRGGADESQVYKNMSKIGQESETKRTNIRKLDEQGSLSWAAKKNLTNQLIHLKRYEETSKKTLELYQKEYDLGRRTLLDLLTAQNDHISSQTQIVRAENDLMLANYRILDAMGTMVQSVLGTKADVAMQRVGIDALDNRLDNDEHIENLIFADRKTDKYKRDEAY